MNVPTKMFSLVRTCSKLTNINTFHISRRFLKINPNDDNKPKNFIQKIIWQVYRPMIRGNRSWNFWHIQYNLITWSLMTVIFGHFVINEEERRTEMFDTSVFFSKIKTYVENNYEEREALRAERIAQRKEQVRRAIEARDQKRLAEKNETNSVADEK